jgi:S1-C subfamily serine protease
MHVATEFFTEDWDELAAGKVKGAGTAELGVTLTVDDEPTLKAVTPGGPAAAAGLKAGDVILTFDGEQVHSKEDLIHLLDKSLPAMEIEVEVRRGAATKTLTVTLGKKSADR